MTLIKITDGRHSRTVPVGHNAKITKLPVGVEIDVSDTVLESLSLSSIAFELVDEEGGTALGVGVVPSPELELLDDSVPNLIEALEKIDDKNVVANLLAAEQVGKTRKTAIAALQEKLAALFN